MNHARMDTEDRERLAREHQRCLRCGGQHPELHHIVSRGRLGSRHLPANHLALCRACHRWVHDRPIWARLWIDSLWPGRYAACLAAASAYKPAVARREPHQVS